MKNVIKLFGIIALFAVIVFSMTACKDDGNRGRSIKYSIQVNNQLAASKSMNASDEVYLYIKNFEYNFDKFLPGEDHGYGIVLIANGDRTWGEGYQNNAGWYGIEEELPYINTSFEPGSYSSFHVYITKLKVNNTEYDFPAKPYTEVLFGHPIIEWWEVEPERWYPDNFSSINLPDSDIRLKTILTVEPDIIGTPNSTGYDSQGLATDPYKFIKVEGKLIN
jgi:hypothetical protein